MYDDLHNPHPLSPMHEDIGLWTMSCSHMFRRFGTPFATDWIAKNVNGYLYTAAIPADPELKIDGKQYGGRYGAVVPLDPNYAEKIGTYLNAVLPTYGEEFVDWWHGRLVPEMRRNFDYLEGMLDKQDELTIMELACLLEDAIDMHDRHWKIHWMLNFAQLSATLNLRAVMEKTHGKIDEALLGRLQSSAKDRNWDSIEALWKMKEEAKADPELALAFKHETAGEIIAALEGLTAGGGSSTNGSGRTSKEFGWHAVWSHEFIFPTVYEQMEPVIELVRGYIETNYDYPSTVKALAEDIEAAAKEILEGLEGEALEEMRAANEINLKMAPAHAGPPLLHRPGRQRPRAAGAHRDRQEARRPGRPRRRRRRDLLPVQRAARVHGRPVHDGRPCPGRAAQGRAGEGVRVPAQGVDRDRHASRSSTSRT